MPDRSYTPQLVASARQQMRRPASGPWQAAGSTFSTLLDWLNKPGSAIRGGLSALQQGDPLGEGLARGWEDYVSADELLGNLGMEEGLGRSALGLAGDVVIDPTLWIPGKWLGAGARALTGGGSKLLSVAKARGTPGLAQLDDLLTQITPYRNLREAPAYQDLARIRDYQLRSSRKKVYQQQEDRFVPILRRIRESGGDVETAMREALLATESGRAAANPEVANLVKGLQDFATERLAREQSAGVIGKGIDPKRYVPHRYLNESSPHFNFDKRVMPETVRPGHAVGMTEPSFTRQRSVPSLKAAEERGLQPDWNLLRTSVQRGSSGERAIILKEHFDRLLTAPEFASVRTVGKFEKSADPTVLSKWTGVPKGWKQFRSSYLPEPLQEQLEGVFFHPEVANDLKHTLEFVEKVDSKFLEGWDFLTNLWKTFATVYRPSFHARNLLSNMYISGASGMQTGSMVRNYGKAFKILRGMDTGKVAGKTADEIRQLAERYAVVGTEFGTIGDLVKTGEQSLKKLLRPGYERAQKLSLNRGMRNVGQAFEDWSRMALFIDQLEKGKNVEQAALHVNKWLINYAEATRVEKNIRRIIPFYMWQRRIVPLLLETAATKPALMGFQGKLKEAFERGVSGDEWVPEAERPEYVQEQGMFQWPFGKGEQGETFYGNLGLPGPDLNVLSLTNFVDELLGRLHPAKAWIESSDIVNSQFGTGAPIAPTGDLNELRPASGIANLLGTGSDVIPGTWDDKVIATLGLVKDAQGNWQAPARSNYLISQLMPFLESLGKGLRTPTAQTSLTVPGPADTEVPRFLWNYLGMPSVAQDTTAGRRYRYRESLGRLRRSLREDALRKLGNR